MLGLASLGAVRCCGEVRVRWKGLAGTSAGAITASRLAAAPTVDDLEQIFRTLDFRSLIGNMTNPLIVDFDPSNDLDTLP